MRLRFGEAPFVDRLDFADGAEELFAGREAAEDVSGSLGNASATEFTVMLLPPAASFFEPLKGAFRPCHNSHPGL